MQTYLHKASILIAALTLSACQTAQSPKSEQHLSQRWEGKPVEAFESRFGKPASVSQNKLTWNRTYDEVTPAHERSFGIGVSGVMIGDPLKNKIEAKSERKICTIQVTVNNGAIAHIDILKDDSTRQAASLCLLTFG